MSETPILGQIRLALSKVGARVFRNQVGSYELKDGRWLSSGLCEGSSDLIGWHTVTIDETMIGQKVALFVAIEVKTAKGKIRPAQERFLAAVKDAGGLAMTARSADEAIKFLKGT